MVDILKKLKYNLDRDSLEKIYFSFIRPKLEYGSHIWDNCLNNDAIRLEDFQWSVARTVTGARRGTSHELIKKELNWPSLAERRKGTKFKNFIKIINNAAPVYLKSLIPLKIGDVRPQSRSSANIYPVKTRTETFKKSFIPSTVKLYNSLDVNNRNLAFCSSLMKNTKSQLFYYGKRVNNLKHCQLRMQCSKLNFHLFLLHVRSSFECVCGNNREDVNHYLLQCPLYNQARAIMFNEINEIGVTITVNNLLYGSDTADTATNHRLFDAVHLFIESTERL